MITGTKNNNIKSIVTLLNVNASINDIIYYAKLIKELALGIKRFLMRKHCASIILIRILTWRIHIFNIVMKGHLTKDPR